MRLNLEIYPLVDRRTVYIKHNKLTWISNDKKSDDDEKDVGTNIIKTQLPKAYRAYEEHSNCKRSAYL